MNTTLSRVSDAARDGAMQRAQELAPIIQITERGDGFVRATVNCMGSCGYHALNDGVHDVVIWHDGRLTCSCVATRGMCFHIGALLVHEFGALPEPPVTCEARGCGGALYYTWDGNGHAPTCPSFGDPDDRYELDAARLGRRVADELAPTARNVVPMSAGRQRAIDKTRPRLSFDGDRVVIRRPCGCVAWEGRLSDQGEFTLPLSPMEGCPEHYDHMQPPAGGAVMAPWVFDGVVVPDAGHEPEEDS